LPFLKKSCYTELFLKKDRFQGFKMCPNSTYWMADLSKDDLKVLNRLKKSGGPPEFLRIGRCGSGM